jgi:pimeloyl-ACP methyl ester carboxylesterase
LSLGETTHPPGRGGWVVQPKPRGAGGRTVAGMRDRLLADVPAAEQQLELDGISTAVLRGGDGPPLVLLHGPGGSAADWRAVLPELTVAHAVVAPDLPGHGSTQVLRGELDVSRVLDWLRELIERTCPSPPALVGNAVGGAIAARFAAGRGDLISRLVLVDSMGLAPFEPAPRFGAALQAFLTAPSPETHDELWRHCALDLDRVREGFGDLWEPFRDYNVNRARTPSVRAAIEALMRDFGFAAIPAAELERVAVPTTLIWGREDIAMPLGIAERASARYGWELRVIERCADAPLLEQPAAFVRALGVTTEVPA